MAQKLDLSTLILRDMHKKFTTYSYPEDNGGVVSVRYWSSILTAADAVACGSDHYMMFPYDEERVVYKEDCSKILDDYREFRSRVWSSKTASRDAEGMVLKKWAGADAFLCDESGASSGVGF